MDGQLLQQLWFGNPNNMCKKVSIFLYSNGIPNYIGYILIAVDWYHPIYPFSTTYLCPTAVLSKQIDRPNTLIHHNGSTSI